ncbi:hypothetical protein TPB0596_03520 [Tsukamurella pulmonis]|uniref:Thioredoxin n=1 Tax=Tsukamurella pulmonis TaxID=47312 RepID=A0A1H1HQ68_9ACTN|nr:thioredoxin domain-containing protein [Tsukamurella pulmonis]KXO94511.1 disulfide bond formation protein [Tsukamurella pulmonis]KXP12325.1 disulfide bond formation protein [Tsukamurella pulmonis]RDH12944.1 disulfide bond formation protein [Tsukamurella pulmonis]SDR27216.1 Thioredoxin [Tsukamurella pulmonis]SUP13758.1 Thiol-disulfide oxidoreductase D [Tsukamurella pulmonis]
MAVSAKRRRDIGLAAILVVVIAVLAGYLAFGRSGDGGRAQAADSAAPTTARTATNQFARLQENDPLAMGPLDAPVVMVIFSDFRCPFCAKFSRDTEPQLIERYVRPGRMRIEWRDLPIFGEQSINAAKAGRAAAEQGRFWEFTHAVFGAAPERGHPDLTTDVLVGHAKEAGVPDLAKFRADFTGDGLLPAVQTDFQMAAASGATSTPLFMINDKPVVGAQPASVFTSIIDAELG